MRARQRGAGRRLWVTKKKLKSPIAATKNRGAEHKVLQVGAGDEEKGKIHPYADSMLVIQLQLMRPKDLQLTVFRHPLMLPFEGLTPS